MVNLWKELSLNVLFQIEYLFSNIIDFGIAKVSSIYIISERSIYIFLRKRYVSNLASSLSVHLKFTSECICRRLSRCNAENRQHRYGV